MAAESHLARRIGALLSHRPVSGRVSRLPLAAALMVLVAIVLTLSAVSSPAAEGGPFASGGDCSEAYPGDALESQPQLFTPMEDN